MDVVTEITKDQDITIAMRGAGIDGALFNLELYEVEQENN